MSSETDTIDSVEEPELETQETSETEEVIEENPLASLAETLGISPDQISQMEDGALQFVATVNGEKIPVSFKDLVKSYQLDRHVTKKSMDLAEQHREFQKQASEKSQELASKIEAASSLVGLLQKEIVSEFNGINWEHLKQVDPGRYLTLRQNYAQKASRVQQVTEKLNEEIQLRQQQQQQAYQDQYTALIERETREMLARNPEWEDPTARQQAFETYSNFLKDSYGYTDEEIDSIVDHRLVELLKDAYAYRNAKQTAQPKLEGKTIPQFRTPSQAQNQATAKARDVKAKRQALRETGSKDALVSLLIDRM